jgi:hypothetical protein
VSISFVEDADRVTNRYFKVIVVSSTSRDLQALPGADSKL